MTWQYWQYHNNGFVSIHIFTTRIVTDGNEFVFMLLFYNVLYSQVVIYNLTQISFDNPRKCFHSAI